jgi:hypothetical protein
MRVVRTLYVTNYWGDKIGVYKIGGEGSAIGREIMRVEFSYRSRSEVNTWHNEVQMWWYC